MDTLIHSLHQLKKGLSSHRLALSLMTVAATCALSSVHAYGPNARHAVGTVCTNHAGGNLLVRIGPGQTFPPHGSIPGGYDVAVLDSIKGNDGMLWYHIRYGRRNGWVRSDYVCGL